MRTKNRLPQQRPQSDREKKVKLIMSIVHPYVYPENVMKVGPVYSRKIRLQDDR